MNTKMKGLPAHALGLGLTVVGGLVASGALVAQTGIAQLGLTEVAARTFVLNEIKGPPSLGRTSAIAVAGTRAFYKLPASARGTAATALFAWAKTYVNSQAFNTAYVGFRRDAIPQRGPQYDRTIDEEVQKRLADERASIADSRQALPLVPMTAADRDAVLASLQQREAQLRSPEFAKQTRDQVEAERNDTASADARAAVDGNSRLPVDPREIFARKLHEFLDATTDVNFSAKTISLAGGADGIEFVNRADRQRSWIWQEAAIVGPEATRAARAAAEAWLKEIER